MFIDLTFCSPNQVSQITVRPSETRMYDLLQCTQEWTIPYSQIYVEGELCIYSNYSCYMSSYLQLKKCIICF